MSDLTNLTPFLDADYLASYLDGHVKGSIAYQIQAIREKLGLNQTEFGELVGMPQSVISRLEDTEYGGTNVNTLLKIAIRLKVGLKIRFCGFDELLDADISPEALAVENIQETISRLQVAPHATNEVSTTFPNAPTVEVAATWQTNAFPNQTQISPQILLVVASGTRNFGTYMQTGVLSR